MILGRYSTAIDRRGVVDRQRQRVSLERQRRRCQEAVAVLGRDGEGVGVRGAELFARENGVCVVARAIDRQRSISARYGAGKGGRSIGTWDGAGGRQVFVERGPFGGGGVERGRDGAGSGGGA